MKLSHLEQMCWAFKGDHPALGAMIAATFMRDRELGFDLEPIEDNGEALNAIEAKGMDAAKCAANGDYFWHPKCAKCDRCRRHRPECFYDKQHGKTELICDRCLDALQVFNCQPK